MKKKDLEVDNDEEFDADEPEEPQGNSDDDWSPKAGSGKRSSSGKGRRAKKPKKYSDEDDEEEASSKKKGGRSKTLPKKAATPAKGKKKKEEEDEELDDEEDNIDDEEDEIEDEEDEVDDEEEEEEETNAAGDKPPKEFSSGAFVVAKSDLDTQGDPPLWKIDGKALLQKYVPFEQDGNVLYKNTSVYSGWTLSNKDQYYPATVVFKQQTRKEHIVEFNKDSLPKKN